MLLVIGLVAVPALLASGSASAAGLQVTMARHAFTPSALLVSSGDTVTWINRDSVPHSVVMTNAPVGVASPALSTDNSWSYTFTQPGTYSYRSSGYPEMLASVTVLPVPGGSQQVAVGQSTSATGAGLDPMLLVAGIVAAVTILCLLLLGSRPESRKP